MPACPKCLKTEVIKRGFLGKKQKWMCKHCSFQFSRLDCRLGKPLKMKQEAVRLYCTGLSMRAISRHIGVSSTSILNWIRKAAEESKPSARAPSQSSVVEIDEFWHYIQKKVGGAGSSKP